MSRMGYKFYLYVYSRRCQKSTNIKFLFHLSTKNLTKDTIFSYILSPRQCIDQSEKQSVKLFFLNINITYGIYSIHVGKYNFYWIYI